MTKEEGFVLKKSSEQDPVAYGVKANVGATIKVLCNFFVERDEAEKFVRREQAKYAGAERELVPLYAAPITPQKPQLDEALAILRSKKFMHEYGFAPGEEVVNLAFAEAVVRGVLERIEP